MLHLLLTKTFLYHILIMMFFARVSPLSALVFIFDRYGALITRVDSHRKNRIGFL